MKHKLNYLKNFSDNEKNNENINNKDKVSSSIDETSSSVNETSSSVNETSSSVNETSHLAQKARRYLTQPDGKRKWIRFLPAKTRGKDKKPRKKGEDHGNWKHGFGKSRPYDTEKYNAWKEAVLRNGNFRCFISISGEDKNLNCHHLNSWNLSEEGRYDASNGVVLSEQIHKLFHSIYGHGYNTRAQFEHFVSKYYGKSFPNEQQGDHEPSFTTESVQLKRI